MKYITYLIIVFFIGCGENTNENEKFSAENTLKYSQWSIYKDFDFYIEQNIDNDANIHHKDNFEKYTGQGIRIVIIDDGLDIFHEDLQGAAINTWDLATNSSNVQHDSLFDYHGTAVTGIISAQDNNIGLIGLAPKSEIFFLKSKPNMSDSETIELLMKADSFNPDIISNSWGTYDVSDVVRDKIESMSQIGRDGKGIIFVWAVGNNQRNIEGDESSIPEVIAVGSTNKNNDRSYYSNYGLELDLLAPGGDDDLGIATLDAMGQNGVGIIENNYILPTNSYKFHGTSASAPIISAIVAILLEINPQLSREEVSNILNSTADKIGYITYDNEHNMYYGYGKVNLSKAIEKVEQSL